MLHLPNCSNTKIVVYGLGISGISAIKAIQRSGGTALAWDDSDSSLERARPDLADCTFVSPVECNWAEISALILSPGIPTTFPSPHWVVDLARKHGWPIKCDIELFLEAVHEMKKCDPFSAPVVVGVTGTNGKSTTTALTGFILNHLGIECEIGGNIGIPALDLPASKKAYVLELSSFHIELLSDSIMNSTIDIAILLNLTPDHIDRHGTFENYILAKERLLVNAKELAIICTDSKETFDTYERVRQKVAFRKCVVKPISTTTAQLINASLTDNQLLYKTKHGDMISHHWNQSELKINLGVNAQNITAAFVAAMSLLPKFFPDSNEVEKSLEIIEAIKLFPGLPHRSELVGTIGNIKFVNDSKSTNADSSEKTLLSFDTIFWIVGGKSKAGGINSLCEHWQVSLCNVKKIFLIGESTEEFATCLIAKTGLPFVRCDDLENAFKMSVREAEEFSRTKNATILLSPACASFDQWKNFEERGDAFRKLAQEYIEKRKD